MDTPPTNTTEESPAPRQAARRRTPKSPEAARRGVVARRMDRRLAALKASKDVAKLERAEKLLAELQDGAELEEEPPAAEPTPEGAAPSSEEPTTAAPPSAEVGSNGWPSAAQLAEFAPLVEQGVNALGALLAGTRFDISGAVTVKVGEQVIAQPKAAILAAGLTPMAAKYLPAALNTPETACCMALFTVFGAPLVELVASKVAAARSGP